MFSHAKVLIKRIDRLLPALLFALLLSGQNLVAVGAAESLIFPELIGPDGSTLTFVDICNSAGEKGQKGKHCGGCIAAKVATLNTQLLPDFIPAKTQLIAVVSGHSVLLDTPERWSYRRRGPPGI